MGNVHMEATQINYREGDKKMSVAQAIKNAGNTGLAHTADIAPDFSAESAYNAGDLVYHNATLYVFTANHAAGAWSADDTQAVTVGGEITSLMSGLNDVTNVTVTAEHQSINRSRTVVYGKKLGKILLVAGYFYINSEHDLDKDELLFTVNQSILSEVYTTIASFGGQISRIKMTTDGKIYTENTLIDDYYYSFEMVAFTN